MFLYRQKGAITMFLSIILLAVMIFVGVLVDYARIKVAKIEARRTVGMSINSLLAGFNTTLKEDFGLFVLHENNREELKQILNHYMSNNLLIDRKNILSKFIDIYKFKVEGVEIEATHSIVNREVIKKQIIEFMKYRAPKEVINEYLVKIDGLKKASATVKTYKEKMSLEKSISDLNKLRERLYELVGPSIPFDNQSVKVYKEVYGQEVYFINRFNNESRFNRNAINFKSKVNTYINIIIEYQQARLELKELEIEKGKLKDSISDEKANRAHAEDEKEEEKYQDRIDDLYNELDELNEDIDNTEDKINSKEADMKILYSEISQQLYCLVTDNSRFYISANTYSKANKLCLLIADEIANQSNIVKGKIQKYEDYLSKNKEKIIDSSYRQLKEEVNEYKKLVPEDKELSYNNGEFKAGINYNIKILENIVDILSQINPSIIFSTNIVSDVMRFSKIGDFKMITDSISKEISNYKNNIKTNIKLNDRVSMNEAKSERAKLKKISNNANKEINEVENKKYVNIPDDLYKLLPSNNKFNENEIKEVLFDEKDKNSYSESSYDFLSGFEFDALMDVRDKIYVNEYIINTFKNNVTSKKPEESNLRNKKKSTLATYFNEAEVEYVLNGSQSEKENTTLTNAKIIMIRFGLNSIHVFTDGEKRAKATSIATVIAGWWSGGAAVPIVRTVVQCAWAMAESVTDLNCLKHGETVPMIKTKANWKTDLKSDTKEKLKVNLSKDENINLDKNKDDKSFGLDTDYMDYLRFLLLLQSEEKSLLRTLDLVQLNTNKQGNQVILKECNVCVKTKATLTIENLFMTSLFFKKDQVLKDNRYRFDIELYNWY
ncbi:DUF5702 domain-containing protein [Clostridiaceae bacterium M8S5]|nr:DUF5702 domain-containing protein [Clostridiaceae bacterium M8S5]